MEKPCTPKRWFGFNPSVEAVAATPEARLPTSSPLNTSSESPKSSLLLMSESRGSSPTGQQQVTHGSQENENL